MKFSIISLVIIVLNARDGTESKYPSIVFSEFSSRIETFSYNAMAH